MKKWIIGIVIGFSALALGVGGAFAYDAVNPVDTSTRPSLANRNLPGRMGQDRSNNGMQPGMRGGNTFTADERSISVEDAQGIAQQWLDDEGLNTELTGQTYTTPMGYAFEYTIDGETAGAVHVNTYTGNARLGQCDFDLFSEKDN
jgi:hypothetical protein